MELVPRALVVGLFAPPAFPGQQPVTTEQINKIWSEVAPGRYAQLQLAPDGAAAQFLGPTLDTGMTIQHPLIQVRDAIKLTPEKTAEELQQLLKAVARHLGLTQVFNLGIKLVCHASVPNNDAKGFILNHVLSEPGANMDELRPPGGDIFAGFKVVETDIPERHVHAHGRATRLGSDAKPVSSTHMLSFRGQLLSMLSRARPMRSGIT